MPSSFHFQRRVEFCETDAAGIAHFSAFFLYMEQAEHAFLRHVGLSVFLRDAEGEGTITWPRVNSQCDFTDAVRFEDLLDINVQIKRLGQKSVTYGFEFSSNGRPTATGKMTSVCCRILPNQPPQSIIIPQWIAERLRTICETAS